MRKSKTLMLILSVVSTLFLLCGCSFFGGGENGFVKFYEPSMTHEQVATAKSSYDYPSQIKGIDSNSVAQLEADTNRLVFYYNCSIIGTSSFLGPLNKENNPTEAAEKVGANFYLTLTIFDKTISGTYTTFVPTYSTTTTTTNSNANAYGSGGYAYGSGSSTGVSTTRSSTPVTNSYSIDRYDQEAIFFLCP
ncbi:hypothetical protein [Helicobacter sp. T3_23-1056]